MDRLQGFDKIRLVRTGPSLRERLEYRATVSRLRRFREQLEREMAPEPWTVLEAPMVLLLSDVCDALGLDEAERAAILGRDGEQALADILEERPVIHRLPALLNERQIKALAYARKHGMINLGTYRQLCPDWSAETLRRDLADLVAQGLLAKNGRKKGTYYTPAA